MADIKISDLTAATTPLGGTEVLPIVQSGVTVKVAVSNLTAGRSVSATAVAITGSTSGTATIVTPAVAGTPTITLPIVTGTLATLAGTETLTNKTLTGAVMNGTVGATTPSTGAFTTISATGSVTATAPANALAVVINGRSSDNVGALYYYANNGSTQHATITASATELQFSSVPAAAVQTFRTNGAERMRIDSSGNVLVTGVAGLGYGTGAGGTVTQATDKSTAVTLNKPCGTITMNGAALGGLTTVTFTLNNSILAAADTITVNLNSSSGNFVNYTIQASAWAAGTVIIKLRNDTVGSLSDAVQFNFNIHKGATS